MMETSSNYCGGANVRLKAVANRLARLAGTDDAANVLRELRTTPLFGCNDSHAESTLGVSGQASEPATADDLLQVGIWKQQTKRGNFVRRPDRIEDWHLWASVGRVPRKRAKFSVALLGESVARGYLFDPQFTPAKALESILAADMGPGAVEVIDLAKTNMTLDQLRSLAREALNLEPDVVVIFAGNNWLGAGFRDSALGRLAATVRGSGVAGLKRAMEEAHRESLVEAVGEIRRLYAKHNARLVWVMPEFNLADWRDPSTNAPWLEGSRNLEWLEHCSAAREALATRDFAAAAEAARRMIALDEGTTATGFQFLAAASQAANDLQSARAHLECARDALMWSPFVKTPRPYSITHRTLRTEAENGGFVLIDLPRLFQTYAGPIPGRRLFLDYCHLSAEGIILAMSAAAAPILGFLSGAERPVAALMGHSAQPEPRVEAEAMFLAAVHNAHWKQPYALVRQFCARALELSPEIADVISCLVELQIRRTPTLMCKAAEAITALPFPSIRQYLLRWNYRQFDRVLLNAATDAAAGCGGDERQRLERLRIEERSVLHAPVQLLDGYYTSSAEQALAQPEVVEEMTLSSVRADYYKACAPESSFVFVGESGASISLSLTCRLPQAKVDRSISLSINGGPGLELPAGSDWRTWDVTLPAAVHDGINQITIRWPMLDGDGSQYLEAISKDLLANVLPDFYPVFGELHSFSVSGAAQAVSATAA
jgi:hypothetical protein